MNSSQLFTLKELSKSIRYGYTASASEDVVGPKFLRITDIVPSQINWETVPYCLIDEQDILRYCLKPGDIVIARTGATVGYAKLIRNGAPLSVFASYLVRVRIDPQKAYPEYIGRVVESDIYKRFILSQVGGAAQPNANAKTLSSFRLPIPEEPIQRKIASILSVYDDLIDTNCRRIQLLEESAQLLFREWFVYFKFSNHKKVKVVDGVPEGWKRINFMDIISAIESGGRPKGGAIDNGVPSIGAENVNGIGNYDYSNEKYVPEEYYQKMKKGKVISKDVLLYKDGANIGRATIVGYGFPHNKCCINEHVFILRTKNNIQNWLYFFLSQDFIRQAVANLNSNCAQPGISQDKLSSLKIIFPDEVIVRLFDGVIESIVKQIFTLSLQNQKLAQARDLLLSRLMSGAIEV
jgi:type I restriction enzyme S subunit